MPPCIILTGNPFELENGNLIICGICGLVPRIELVSDKHKLQKLLLDYRVTLDADIRLDQILDFLSLMASTYGATVHVSVQVEVESSPLITETANFIIGPDLQWSSDDYGDMKFTRTPYTDEAIARAERDGLAVFTLRRFTDESSLLCVESSQVALPTNNQFKEGVSGSFLVDLGDQLETAVHDNLSYEQLATFII